MTQTLAFIVGNSPDKILQNITDRCQISTQESDLDRRLSREGEIKLIAEIEL
ncbi:MAG: hypothetical protein AB4290_06865 [Spirulina sp.]